MPKNLAIIPLRSGSKGIPNKNVKSFNGKPLASWIINSAIESKIFSDIVIAIDSKQYEFILKDYITQLEKVKFFYRDPHNAEDFSQTEDVMEEVFNNFELDNFFLLQATSPLTSATHLKESYSKLLHEKSDSLLSVVRQKRFIWDKVYNGFVQSKNYNIFNRPRRQNFDGILVENGAIYITTSKAFQNTRTRISGNISFYEMPEETYFEVDTEVDWKVLEMYAKAMTT